MYIIKRITAMVFSSFLVFSLSTSIVCAQESAIIDPDLEVNVNDTNHVITEQGKELDEQTNNTNKKK